MSGKSGEFQTASPWVAKAPDKHRLLVASIVLAMVALVVRLAFLLIAHGGRLTNPDSAGYILLAHQLANGGRYIVNGSGKGYFPLDLIRPPGYPAFLMVANGGPRISVDRIAITQILLGAGSVGLLTYAVGRWLNTRPGVLAGGLLALDWITVVHTPLIVADFPMSILYAAAIGAFGVFLHSKRTRWALLSGAFLGLTVLVKPAGEFGLAVLVIAVLASPRANWRGLACLVTFALIAVPWAIRNDRAHGILAVSAISSINIYEYTAEVALRGSLLWTATQVSNLADSARRRVIGWHLQPAGLKARMDHDSRQIIFHRLPKVAVQAGLGAFATTFGTARDTLATSIGDQKLPAIIAEWLPLGQLAAMWLLAVLGVVSAWRRQDISKSITVLLVAGVLLIILPAASPVGYARFRLPATPLLCILAAIGATKVTEFARRALLRRQGAPVTGRASAASLRR